MGGCRNGERDGAISSKKRLERLLSFFRFAAQTNRVKQNPVVAMRPPKVSHPPTLPFSQAAGGKDSVVVPSTFQTSSLIRTDAGRGPTFYVGVVLGGMSITKAP
jgi:hypothetical protein